ncbi:hypothetical protein ABN239_01940 [Providencia vermicola]|uniref:hypothetical protein n=1 Tax=Providencia vermicola TaxID=333965 RepID=UPI0032DBEAF5
MRKYIPLLPVLLFIFISILAISVDDYKVVAGAEVVRILVNIYVITLFFSFSPNLESGPHFCTLKGITKSLIPFNLNIYRLVIVLNVIAAFLLIVTKQWISIPLLVVWFAYQYWFRKTILSAISSEA